MNDDIAAMMREREAADRRRAQERLGISGAAAAGVFDKGRPKELDLVAQRDRWMAEQWDNAMKPQDHTAVPILPEDGVARDETVGHVVPARWDTGSGIIEGPR